MASDGKIIIDTKLDISGFEKDVETASKKAANDLGKGTEKAMKQAETSINNVGKAFKNIDFSKIAKQMESVGNSIDKTSSKIEAQKAKLEKLKTSYENATNVKQKDNISAQMEKTTLSIGKLESKLSSLNAKKLNLEEAQSAINGLDGEFKSASVSIGKSADTINNKTKEINKNVSSNLTNVGEKISKAGDKISSVGSKLTTGVTLPLTGMAVAAAKVGMDFDSSMSRVQAISGATGDEFTQLHDQALKLGKDTAFSAKEAANGMENLASAGFNTTEIMSAMPGMLDLAASSGESVATSSDIAASALRGFGLEASDASHVADVLAQNASKTNAQVADTGEALKYVATNAHAAGWSLEETTAAIGELSNYGVKGSQAGTTLREMLVRLASPSKEAAGDMEALGFNAFDSQGKMKSLSTVISEYSKALEGKTDKQKQDYTATIFGQEAMSGMLALVQGGSSALDDLTNSYKASDGAASSMAKIMQDNSKSSIEQMVGSLETAAITVEEDFAPMIIEAANYIQDLANKFASLTPEEQEFYVKLLAVAAGIGPVVKGAGTLTTIFGGLTKAAGWISKTFGTAAAAETVLGAEAATATTGGLAGLASGLAAIAPVAIPVAAALAALTLGVAAYETAQDQLDDKLTRTTDNMNDWEKAINGMTGYTFKSRKELEDLGIEYKDFGDNISDNFKKKVEESTQTLHEFELFLGKMNLDKVIDDSESNSFNTQIEKMVNDAINTINSKKAETQKSLSDLFKLDDDTIDSTEQSVIDSISKGYDSQISEENQLKSEILAIKQKAVDEKRALNDQEVKDVKDKTEKIKEIELEAAGGTDEEKAYAKNEFSARVESVNPEDASKILQEKKQEFDEENVQIKAQYDTQLDMLKQHIKQQEEIENDANSSDAEKEAAKTEIANAQAEYDKFSELKDKKVKLKSDEWAEYIKIFNQKNPEALALVDVFDGKELEKQDLVAQQKLKSMKETFQGLNDITESGTYKLWNTTTNSAEDVTVTVDKATGLITGAYSETTEQVGGYTEQMAQDNAELGVSHSQLAAECQTALNNLAGAHINASGQITNASGQMVGALDNVTTAADGTTTGILNINGTPIEIQTNADGTISNMNEVTTAIQNIPEEKYVDTSSNAPDTTNDANNLKSAVDAVPTEHSTVFKAVMQGWDSLKQAFTQADFSYTPTFGYMQKYTGTNGGDEGLSYVNEHKWEISSGSEQVAYLGSGSQIMDHMTSVNEMNQEISSQVGKYISPIIQSLNSALSQQTAKLSAVADNTGEIVDNDKTSSADILKQLNLSSSLASDLVNSMNKRSTGTFSGLQSELNNAQIAVDLADSMKVEDNYWVSYYTQWKKSVEDEIKDTEDKDRKEELEKQKDYLDEQLSASKDAAQDEIEACKYNAKEQEKIAEEKKDKLVKLAEATTDAIKAQLEAEKSAAEKVINDELDALETSYNNKIAKIKSNLSDATAEIDDKLAELEDDSTEEDRDNTRQEYKDSIAVLETKMANTASEADKKAYALQIKDKKAELSNQEDAWDLEDEKAALEDEKALLEEKAQNKEDEAEEEYNTQKEALETQLKNTDAYYDKLLETDSVNAQARYTLLNSRQEDLVTLLNSYAPNWQDAGQSLADSLLTGLNSNKQSVSDAVSELVALRSSSATSTTSSSTGYATGTSNNAVAGLYNVDEDGFEVQSGNAVAYVGQGAAIKNHMESEQYINAEIANQVALMKSSILAEQANMQNALLNSIAGNSNSSIVTNDNAINFNVDNFHNYSSSDIEQIANELGTLAYRKKKY